MENVLSVVANEQKNEVNFRFEFQGTGTKNGTSFFHFRANSGVIQAAFFPFKTSKMTQFLFSENCNNEKSLISEEAFLGHQEL